MDEMRVVESPTGGTYSVSVRWSGCRTVEVEADNEDEACVKAAEACEQGLMESDIDSTAVQWFQPYAGEAPTEGDGEGRTAKQWAALVVSDFLKSGLRRTAVDGVSEFRVMPRAVLRELPKQGGVSLSTEGGITYLVRPDAAEA